MQNSFGYNSRTSFPEDFTYNESLSNKNPWPENRGYRTRSQYVECDDERVSSSKREFLFEKDNKMFRNEQRWVPSATNFAANNYSPTDRFYVDNSRRAVLSSPWPLKSFKSNAVNHHNVSQPSFFTGLDNLSILPSSTSDMKPNAFRSVQGENMFGVQRIGNYSQHSDTSVLENILSGQVTDVIQLANGILYPPNPIAPLPTVTEKPLGCKTVYIDGLTQNITEEIVRELFVRCGTIETVRMSKDFCCIRFCDESSVDKAISFSGCRLKVENEATWQLHVDYCPSRDDEYDYERKQRALKRQVRHAEQAFKKPPNLPVEPYADNHVSRVCDKLKSEDTVMEAANTLITWLERGACTKKNAGYFFSMIQSAHTHVKKLEMDKIKYENQLGVVKTLLKKQLECIIRQLTEIEKIYKAATMQKCWDQFTKAQRKNIETWKKETEVLKDAHLQKVIDLREDAEMELSDDEKSSEENSSDINIKKSNIYVEELKRQYERQGESLKSQLEASQRVIKFLKADHEKDRKTKDDKIKIMEQAIENLTCQLKAAESKVSSLQSNHDEELKRKNDEITSLQQTLQNLKSQLEGAQSKIVLLQSEHEEALKRKDDQIVSMQQTLQNSVTCQLEVAESNVLLMQSGHEEELKQKDAQIASMQQALQNLRRNEFDLIQEKTRIENELKELLLKVLLQ